MNQYSLFSTYNYLLNFKKISLGNDMVYTALYFTFWSDMHNTQPNEPVSGYKHNDPKQILCPMSNIHSASN